jgi:GWxTD domain-containing protein
MRRYLLFSSLFLIVISFWGCHTVSILEAWNFADQYNETTNHGRIEAVPFALNDSTAHIYFRLPYHELVYKTKGQGKISQALFRLHFEVYLNYESPVVIDSGTFSFLDSLHAGSSQMFNFEFDVKAVNGQNYILSLTLDDINKRHAQNTAIYINRKTGGSSSSFKASQSGVGLLYTPVLENKQDVVITTSDTALKSLWVNVYQRKFPLPSPPSTLENRTSFDYKPDSSFSLQLKNGVASLIELNKPGFYYFRSDTTIREGFTLFRFSEGFPELVSVRQLLVALRYITSGKEFDAMSTRSNTRSAVDSFWLATAGNTDRALTLLREYYSRVQRANELFSSFTEGWQTDRGMIYIVIGPPNVVYRSNLKEEWVYGEAGNMRSMYFYFMKIDNPFTSKDYVLLRDPTIKQAWYMAVERWRR